MKNFIKKNIVGIILVTLLIVIFVGGSYSSFVTYRNNNVSAQNIPTENGLGRVIDNNQQNITTTGSGIEFMMEDIVKETQNPK